MTPERALELFGEEVVNAIIGFPCTIAQENPVTESCVRSSRPASVVGDRHPVGAAIRNDAAPGNAGRRRPFGQCRVLAAVGNQVAMNSDPL